MSPPTAIDPDRPIPFTLTPKARLLVAARRQLQDAERLADQRAALIERAEPTPRAHRSQTKPERRRSDPTMTTTARFLRVAAAHGGSVDWLAIDALCRVHLLYTEGPPNVWHPNRPRRVDLFFGRRPFGGEPNRDGVVTSVLTYEEPSEIAQLVAQLDRLSALP